MKFVGLAVFVLGLAATSAFAEATTPPHSIAVAGEAEVYLPPDYATIELGVVTQAPLVGDALAENSARMTQVIAAIRASGILDKDIHTSTFLIQPKYEKMDQGNYDTEQFRTITGYYISNKVTVTVRDMTKIAAIIDASVKAGANASGNVNFQIDSLTAHLDEARRKAIETARHKAEVLTQAAHVNLGSAISITDNEADVSYNDETRGYNYYGNGVETVVVTASRVPTPIEPGLISIISKVTIVYALR